MTQFDFDDEGPEPKTVLTPRRTPGMMSLIELHQAKWNNKDIGYNK